MDDSACVNSNSNNRDQASEPQTQHVCCCELCMPVFDLSIWPPATDSQNQRKDKAAAPAVEAAAELAAA